MGSYTFDDLLQYKAQTPSPKRVVLCGSTRFMQAFQEANLRETLAGNIVLTIGCDTKSDNGLALSEQDKFNLDLLHLHKIDLADEMFILNVDGYIGVSTAREICYGATLHKRMRFLEPAYLFTAVCSLCGRLYRWTFDDIAWMYEASPFAPCGCSFWYVVRLNLVCQISED